MDVVAIFLPDIWDVNWFSFLKIILDLTEYLFFFFLSFTELANLKPLGSTKQNNAFVFP